MALNELDFLLPEDEREKEGFAFLDFSQIIMAAAFTEFGEAAKYPRVTTAMLRHLVLNSLKKNKKDFKKQGYQNLVVCVDNSKSGYWRRDYSSYYKKNRKVDREDSPFDWEGLFNAMHIIIEELEKYMPYIVMNIDKVEADDHIAVLIKHLTSLGHPCVIVSSDGDFTQLHKYPGVKQWSPMQKKWVKTKSGDALMDCVTKVIKGDKKDNVASIKVRGNFWLTRVDGERTPSTTAKELDAFALNYYDDEAMEKLLTEEQFKRFKENQLLIDMDSIPDGIVALIMERYNNYQVPAKSKVYPYFVKSGLSKLTAHVQDFY
jgi:hypothetical protein